MKVVFLSSLCGLALACGGAQKTNPTPAGQTAPSASVNSSPKQEGDVPTAAAVEKLRQEQNEMFQLFQLLAGQVESLQAEVADLRAEQAIAKDRPARPARPSRPRPNPASIYAVPIANNPSRGSKRPLVTIIESFEFA